MRTGPQLRVSVRMVLELKRVTSEPYTTRIGLNAGMGFDVITCLLVINRSTVVEVYAGLTIDKEVCLLMPCISE